MLMPHVMHTSLLQNMQGMCMDRNVQSHGARLCAHSRRGFLGLRQVGKGGLEMPVLIALSYLRGRAVHTRQLVRLIHARGKCVILPSDAAQRLLMCGLLCTQDVQEGVIDNSQKAPAQAA